jgi:chaperonin cofactor prefoldin
MSVKERLARVETNLEQLVFETRQLHGELRDGISRQELRVRTLEQNAEQVRTHLRWMKAAWVAVQGAVLTWLGLK